MLTDSLATSFDRNGDSISPQLREEWNNHFKVLRLVDSPPAAPIVEHRIHSISIKQSEYDELVARSVKLEQELDEVRSEMAHFKLGEVSQTDMEMK
jgi:hypothetical protein